VPQDRAPRPAASGQDFVPDVSPVSGVPSTGTYFLGRYRVVDEIGIGGMASVHLARVDGLGGFQRWFAIKRIHPHLVEDDTFVNMFLDEANVAARISHPNVATVFELGKHDDTYWIAMEYLHGEPLREVMRRTEEMGSTMPPEIACRVIAEAADGLHAAHELQGKDGEKLNLIHRDVTPHNLFVTYDGVTKVVDFGIAKFQDRMASTQAGTLKGKLAYMSPEQVKGESIDRRTDIFALGVVLWELTTGRRLFRMDSDLDTLAKVQECVIPRPSTLVRGYPVDLEQILMQALAKNRNERFPTAREFSRALQSLLTRRGLFIAQDEVAGYMASIFEDRIVKREEHLRWASAVSDAAAAAAAAASGNAPRASTTSAPARAQTAPPRALPTSSVQPAPRPARPLANGPPSSSFGGEQRTLQVGPQHNLARPPTVPFAVPGSPRGPTMGQPSPRRPAPQAAAPVDDDDEDRTVQATAAQQAAAHAGYADDFDDNDATIVSRAPSDNEPASAGTRQAPPAAGRPVGLSRPPAAPLPSFSAATPAPAPFGQRTMGMPGAPVGRPPPGPPQLGSPLGPQPTFPDGAFADRGIPPTFNISDPSLPSTMASPAPPLPPVPPPWSPQVSPLPFPAPQYGQGPPGYNPPGQMPYGAPPPQGMQQYGAPPIMPAAPIPVRRAPIPAWAVAVASGLVALVVAGGAVLLYNVVRSRPSTPAPVVAGRAPTGSASAPPPVASAAPSASGGVFGGARAGFLAAATPPKVTTQVPDTPPDVASAVAAAPPPPPPDPTPAVAAAPPPAAPSPPPDPAPAVAPTPQPASPPVTVAHNTQPTPAPPAPKPAAPDPSPPAASGGTGLLSVICLPGCDQVYDGNKLLGPSPIFKRSVSLGSHRLRLVTNSPPGTKVISTIVTADAVNTIRVPMP